MEPNLTQRNAMSLVLRRKRTVIEHNYTLQDKILERATPLSDLGLIVDERLNWNYHIVHVTNKANQRLGLVKRTLGYNMSREIKLQCYKSMVQPILEYGKTIWSNCSRRNIKKIEHRRGTRYIINDYQNEIDYRTRLSTCNLLPLTFRRTYLDLSFLVKS